MQLSLDRPAKDLAGKETSNTLGKILAEHILAQSSKGPAIRFMAWAQKLYAGEPIEINTEDYGILYQAVETNEVVCNFVKADILTALIEAKQAASA